MSISSMTNAAIARRSDNRFPPPDGHNGTARDIDAAAAAPARRDGSGTQAGPADTTLDVLFRYIPTEILTVYLAVVAALQPTAGAAITVATVCHPFKGSAAIAFWTFFAATPIVVWIVYAGKLRADGKELAINPSTWPLWEMCAAPIAFAAWAFALPQNPFSGCPWYSASIAALSVLITSAVLGLLSTLFGKKDNLPKPDPQQPAIRPQLPIAAQPPEPPG